jgi:choline-sulfatase
MAPNIIIVLTDDHAQWAAGCYGNSEVRTPTLDYLARSGVSMTEAFTPTPVCSPARASFWTGRMPSQHGMHDFLAEMDPEVAAQDWLAGERILADHFHEAGYTTGLSGKWHMGRPASQPECFDYWYSISAPVAKPHRVSTPWEAAPESPGTYNPHAITDHAVDFLRRRPQDKPFFLFVGYIATHSPWSGHPERIVDSYRTSTFRDIPQDTMYPFGRLAGESVFGTRKDGREALAQYYASVTEIDEQMGRIVDELDAQGIREDTLLVYTSDHGMNTGHHGLWGKGNATRPYNMVEESIRIPMILNRPGHLLEGQSRAEMVTHCDLFQTVLEHANVKVSDSERLQRNFPGRSFHDLTRGKADGHWPDAVFGEYGDLRMIRTRSHKLIQRDRERRYELFDLIADPRETVNIANISSNSTLIKELSGRIDSYFEVFSEPNHSGLRVADMPRHNSDEDWRVDGEHVIVASPDWIREMDKAVAQQATE